MQSPADFVVHSIIPALMATGIVPRALSKPKHQRWPGLVSTFLVCAVLNYLVYADRFDEWERLWRAALLGAMPLAVGWLLWSAGFPPGSKK